MKDLGKKSIEEPTGCEGKLIQYLSEGYSNIIPCCPLDFKNEPCKYSGNLVYIDRISTRKCFYPHTKRNEKEI